MAESSMFWDGVTLGDATAAPYDAANEFSQVMRAVSGVNSMANLGGMCRNVGSILAPSIAGAVSPVTIGTGEAIVHGTFYANTAAVQVVIPNSVASRYDRIVLRKDWATQTVRIYRIAGVEGGGEPALVQTPGVAWDVPICTVRIQVAALTLYDDYREYIPQVIQLSHRQGGNATDWAIAGNSNYTFPQPPSIFTGLKTIAPGGSTITYPHAFSYEPIVQITIWEPGGAALMAVISAILPASCTVHIYDHDATDVGGTVYWTATGYV